jgi:hypothetical protein
LHTGKPQLQWFSRQADGLIMRRPALALTLLVALLVLVAPRTAMAAGEADSLLVITGLIAPPAASEGGARFSREDLEALPQHETRTSTPWTDGVSTFEGPLLCDLLDKVGAEGTLLRAKAVNDYEVDIPIEDCRRYPVIVALKRDGQPLSRRDMGPLWIVYPRDDHPELQLETINARWIWQLIALEVK